MNRGPTSRAKQGVAQRQARIGRNAKAGRISASSRKATASPVHAEREKVNRIPSASVNLENQSVGCLNSGASPDEAASQITRATTRRPPYAFGSSSIPDRRKPS